MLIFASDAYFVATRGKSTASVQQRLIIMPLKDNQGSQVSWYLFFLAGFGLCSSQVRVYKKSFKKIHCSIDLENHYWLI